jgi:hypothetical protein
MVDQDCRLTVKAYDYYKSNGVFPTDILGQNSWVNYGLRVQEETNCSVIGIGFFRAEIWAYAFLEMDGRHFSGPAPAFRRYN